MTAEIIPFPIDAEVVFIRQVARSLERRTGDAADRFWRTECNRLYGRLQVQGLKDPEIQAAIKSFSEAVQLEMQRAAWAAQAHDPKGAA